jgi:hypothetical protein
MNKTTFILLSVLTFGFITVRSDAGGDCCGGIAVCPKLSSQPITTTVGAVTNLSQPVASVFDAYAAIQVSLANDSLDGVAAKAQAISTAVKTDSAKTFSASISQQAGALAQAADLPAARDAFKSLSDSLIAYRVNNQSLAATYRQVHCSMANADWLQTGSVVSNPYLGKAMAQCGQFVEHSAR